MLRIQTELDRERSAGAAQAARLRGQIEELQGRVAQEEHKLAERVARAQKVSCISVCTCVSLSECYCVFVLFLLVY